MSGPRERGPRAAAGAPDAAQGSGRRAAAVGSDRVDASGEPGTAEATDIATDVATDVAIVGAGIAGLSLADALARRGRTVRVLEAGRIGAQGASALPLALLNPHRGRSGRAHPDDLAGLAAFWRRDARLRADGFDPGAERSGVLRVAASAAQADRWRALAASVDTASWLEPPAVPAGVRAPHGALLVPDGGWVDPPRLLAALARSAAARGADLVEGARVVGVGRVDAADPTDGFRGDGMTRLARAVVLCVGADADAGLPIPDLTRLEGDVITLAPAEPLPHPIAGGVYGGTRSDPTGSGAPVAAVGGNHRTPATATGARDDAEHRATARALRDRFARSVPGLADAEVVAHWRGVRAKRPGHRPWTVERAPDVWFLGAFAGRGFLCAAAEAERLVERLDARLDRGADPAAP